MKQSCDEWTDDYMLDLFSTKVHWSRSKEMPSLTEIQKQREALEKHLANELAKLDEQEAKAKKEAKDRAMAKVEDALKELNALGYNYKLTTGKAKATRTRGKTQAVLSVIEGSPNGISTAELMEKMNATDDKAKASISASLNSLKKRKLVTAPKRGFYKAV